MVSIDTFESATKAAALGGTTAYIDFAWQSWAGALDLWDEPGTIVEGIERDVPGWVLECAEVAS